MDSIGEQIADAGVSRYTRDEVGNSCATGNEAYATHVRCRVGRLRRRTSYGCRQNCATTTPQNMRGPWQAGSRDMAWE